MRAIKSLFVLATGLLAGAYLLNIGVGIVEFLPDNLPIVGNLDEATATLLLINCLAYFGIDLRRAVRRPPDSTSNAQSPNA